MPRDGDLSPAAFGRDLAAVLDAVAPEGPVVLVGHSMGAIAILSAAETRPDLFAGRIAGVVFVGAAIADLCAARWARSPSCSGPGSARCGRPPTRVNRLRRYVLASPADVAQIVARITQFGPDRLPARRRATSSALAGRAPSARVDRGARRR